MALDKQDYTDMSKLRIASRSITYYPAAAQQAGQAHERFSADFHPRPQTSHSLENGCKTILTIEHHNIASCLLNGAKSMCILTIWKKLYGSAVSFVLTQCVCTSPESLEAPLEISEGALKISLAALTASWQV